MTLGSTGPDIERFDYWPSVIGDKAASRVLVIAGVHGSERAGIEIARRLVTSFGTVGPATRSVTIVPVLFPVNYAAALQSFAKRQGSSSPRAMGDSRTGRRTGRRTGKHTDPNRQFPTIGHCLASPKHVDSEGREIEGENVFLLKLIEELKPIRIISIHSIARPSRAVSKKDQGKLNLPGVFVDPVTNLSVSVTRKHPLTKPGLSSDDALALKVANAIKKAQEAAIKNKLVKPYYKDEFDSWVAGNWLDSKSPSARYARPAAPTQKRYSLGEWGPRAVAAKTCAKDVKRAGIPVFTIEARRYYASTDYLSLYKAGATSDERKHNQVLKAEHTERILELAAHAMALRSLIDDWRLLPLR